MVRRILPILLLAVVVLAEASPAEPSSPADTLIVIRPELTERAPRIPGFIPRQFAQRPRVALVLSGGGARGAAAIGVLQVLERNGIPVDLIVGTSIGSIVGGLYASGYSTDELERLLDTTRWDEIMSLNDDARRRDMFLDQKLAGDKSVLVLRFKGLEPVLPESFSTGQRLTNFLNLLTLRSVYKPDPTFDQLRIPFRAVTTDLVSGKAVVLDRGDLAEAMRASMAIPLLFSSVKRDTLQLLDGGLVANLPVDEAREAGADIVISVDMTSPLRPRSMLNAPWEIADQITTIMMQEAKLRAREKSEVVIIPAIGNHLSSDFGGLDSLIALGRAATDSALPIIRQVLARRARSQFAEQIDIEYRNLTWRATALGNAIPLPAEIADYRSQESVTHSDLRALAGQLAEDGQFAEVELAVRTSGDSTDIELRLRPYPVIRSVELVGVDKVSRDTIETMIRPMLGRPLNVRAAEQVLDRILEVYRERGYVLARIRHVRYDSTQHTATLEIDEGVVERSEVRGSDKTRDWVIWRELPWSNGEVFHMDAAARGIANLYGTNLFEQVLVSVRHEGPGLEKNIVVVNVRERNTELIRLGLRVDNDRNIQPSIDLRDENFLGAGAELGAIVGFGPRNLHLLGELRATRIFNSYLTFGLKTYYGVRDVNVYTDAPFTDPKQFDRIRIGEYRERRFGAMFSFGTQLERLGNVTVDGRFERLSLSNVFAEPIADQTYRISSIKLGTTIDTQDKYPFPGDGVVIDLSYESAFMKPIEAVGFTKFFMSYERYHAVADGHTLRPKIVLGVADETLPLSEQFSLGGQHSFFGYPEDNARGRQLLLGSIEYQYQLPLRLFFDTYFKARYDIGSIWLKPEEIRLEDLEHGIGVSLAFDTPVGPAEFSVGRSFVLRKDLLERPVSWGPLSFYFSIGYPLTIHHQDSF